jgi:hypothetical protein
MKDVNERWKAQEAKNKTGKPRYVITSFPDGPEAEFMDEWLDKWGDHFSYMNNAGCGCCINIYEFDAPDEAVAEVPDELLEPYKDEPRSNASK